MRTTITLSPVTRDRILALKRKLGVPSAEAALLRLLDGEPLGAKALYLSRKKEVDAVLRRRKVKRLVAFGSRARGDARPDSDLDLVVSLPPGADLFTLAALQEELSTAFGVTVQAVSASGLKPRLRAEVKRDGVRLAA
ncbi:MAG TPA: nucleotidyltransferase family protein [Candidatus Thermoplasmatota archaeon]|nr:nucleotidyltransferase family protein [Candidatus Thermoplasmatota archaeon]